MLLCCGPSNKGEGKGMVRAAAGSTTRDAGRRFFAPLSALSRKPASSRLTPALKLTGSDLSPAHGLARPLYIIAAILAMAGLALALAAYFNVLASA